MYLRLYKHTKNDKYLNFAIKCGECIWERGILQKGVGLCHGIGGMIITNSNYKNFVEYDG